MKSYLCVTCGVQYAPSRKPPGECVVCEDERQWVPYHGQTWTTLDEMRDSGYKNIYREYEFGLTGIGTKPAFGIGQRALLIQTPYGNILWDCISYIDQETVAQVKTLGGIDAIAICHPHFYSSMLEWSYAFGKVPIYIHQADRKWVMSQDPTINFFDASEIELFPGITVIHCGGHFDGSTVLHWAEGAEGRGVLMSGDTLQVAADRKHVSFLYSYPNMIPLSPVKVRDIAGTVLRYKFDRVYGIHWNSIIEYGGESAISRSVDRYIKMVES